ncbi:MAG: anthranilate synthase component I family protein [Bacteroidia bacterium]|nr:MAG: anthranilate synthase component I family protein [Bacteroidia bacterium]
MDSHQYQQHTSYEFLAAAGVQKSCTIQSEKDLYLLDPFLNKGVWQFGHISYEAISNGVSSQHAADAIQFPLLFFYQPQIIITCKNQELEIFAENADEIYHQILNTTLGKEYSPSSKAASPLVQVFDKNAYMGIIQQLQQHIHRGDCYEINFCQKFFIESIDIDIFKLYKSLTHISPNPQTCLYKVDDAVLICASPERFIKKEKRKIISQPIKGTLAKKAHSGEALIQEQNELLNSEKDRAENIMVVDLVRNDLSKVSIPGTVKVEELFGIYSFPQVHQMITTIAGELKSDVSFSEILKSLFPMGSMTGAPKKKVMELIQKYETYQRGIFSGTVGYMSPDGDFDFNVVIRSILYNTQSKYLTFYAGSGITAYSDAEKEWEECQLKAEAILKVLGMELPN